MYTKSKDYLKWFPKNTTHLEHGNPRFRIFCFQGAGMDHVTFTSYRTSGKTIPNALVEFCQNEAIEYLVVQLPGRGSRFSEAFITDMGTLVKQIFEIIKPLLVEDTCNYAFMSYSLGCICAFELLRKIRDQNLSLPKHFFISSMISADSFETHRNWKKASDCNSKELQIELASWGANDVIFSKQIWELYEPIFRADFGILDDYKYTPDSLKLQIPITCFYVKNDTKISLSGLKMWEGLFTHKQDTKFIALDFSSHSFPYDNKARETWMKLIISELELILDDEG